MTRTSAARTLGLLLIDDFALMSYASVIEPYRAANVLAGGELYRWIHVSVDGHPVRASNGASVVADQAVGQPLACDTLFVFAGGEPATFRDAATFAWLREIARKGATLACGFRSSSHFSRAFKARHGVSPVRDRMAPR